MKRPNKRTIAQAIYVTSHGHPRRYSLRVRHVDTDGHTCEFADLDTIEVGSIAAANALVRAMREHVEKVWRAEYAAHKHARRVAAAKAR